MPKFTSDWFSGHVPHWRKMFSDIGWNPHEAKTAVEIGCYEGRSAVWMLENLLQHPDSRIHCIDTFAGGDEHTPHQAVHLFERFRRNIAEREDAKKVTVYRMNSTDGLRELWHRKIAADFVYIDGSHQPEIVLSDLVLSFILLKVGGLIICDDYLWPSELLVERDNFRGPKEAIDAFTNINRARIKILLYQRLYQLAFVKTGD